MMYMNRTLDIFYNQIIKEACVGRINCFFYFNMPFSTFIQENNELYKCKFKNSKELLIPTLMIKNKKHFDKLLIEYTNLALNFYSDEDFAEEILNDKMFEEDKICKEKVILTTLFSNATVEDFINPIQFLERRINFLKNQFSPIERKFIETFEGDLSINITKDNILNETPYQFEIVLTNSMNEKYNFPKIKFGIHNNKAFIYSIQNKEQEKTNYVKKVNRKLYQINDGFIDNYDEENLKDVTPSFVVAANIFISYITHLGIEEVLIPNVLIERWNAKSMAIMIKAKQKNLSLIQVKEEIEKQNKIWMNINEKLIRTFRRLEYHHKQINITSEPFLVDSYLHLKIDDELECNNALLYNIYNVFEEKTKTRAK